MADAIAPWGDSDRERLQRARVLNGHDQAACAAALQDLGCRGANQTSVSRWETGKIRQPRLDTVTTLRKYSVVLDAESPEQGDTSFGSVPSRDGEPFDSVVRGFTNEPLLGPRQAALVDALTERLQSGPAMSEADNGARIDLMALLGLAAERQDGHLHRPRSAD